MYANTHISATGQYRLIILANQYIGWILVCCSFFYGQGKCKFPVAVLLALNPTDAGADCLFPCSSSYLLNVSFLKPNFQQMHTHTKNKTFVLEYKDYTFDGAA